MRRHHAPNEIVRGKNDGKYDGYDRYDGKMLFNWILWIFCIGCRVPFQWFLGLVLLQIVEGRKVILGVANIHIYCVYNVAVVLV